MPDISRIFLQDQTYEIKDALNRHNFNVLIGVEPPDEGDTTDSEENSEEE